MKRLIATFSLLLTMIAGASAQNDAMYVYRNDGVINAFLKTDIDSVRYSHLDLDSMFHKEYMVQEVWTVDSIYRIPLELIDSVSFVTPETVYQPGTINITAEMRDYIISSDSLQLTFASNTPDYILPRVGDKLVNTEASGGLLSGFLGKVKSIDNSSGCYVVNCDLIALTDVFECYYGIVHREDEPTSKVPNQRKSDTYFPMNGTWNPGKLSKDIFNTHEFGISYEKDGNLLIPSLDNAECTVSLTPKVQSISYLIVNKEYGVNLSIGIYGDYTLEEYLALAGSLTGGGDIKLCDGILYRFPEILCDVTFEAGVFFRGAIQIATEQKWTQKYKSAFHWEYSSKGIQSLNNTNDIRNVENSHSGILALKGNFDTGLYLKVGFAFIATSNLDIAEAGLRLEGGLHFEGTALPYISNPNDALKSPDLYNMMKGQGAELSVYYGTSFYANLFSWGGSWAIPNFFNIPFSKKWVLNSCYYVPEFSETKLKKDKYGDYFASTNISEECLPTDIGFSLQNKNNSNDCVNAYCIYDYKGPNSSASATFYQKPSKEPYIVYPLVKFGELEMLAEPSAELEEHSCPDDHHPHAIDLGLPSGTKWACCNVGASSPEQYGGYYAWGETSEKSCYDWYTYKWCNGSYDSFTKYCTHSSFGSVDGKTVLDLSDDVAHVRMGGSWRMPSHEQQEELVRHCTCQWTQQNGVIGILVTGPSGGQVFLPAAGFRWGDYLGSEGSYSLYWSSSLRPNTNGYGAYCLCFDSDHWTWDCDGARGNGQPVRAVCP